jgi:hypothetical protein
MRQESLPTAGCVSRSSQTPPLVGEEAPFQNMQKTGKGGKKYVRWYRRSPKPRSTVLARTSSNLLDWARIASKYTRAELRCNKCGASHFRTHKKRYWNEHKFVREFRREPKPTITELGRASSKILHVLPCSRLAHRLTGASKCKPSHPRRQCISPLRNGFLCSNPS